MLISTLKKLLLESKQFNEIWNYFFDLMEQGNFIEKSTPIHDLTKNEVLVKVLATIEQHFFKKNKIVPSAFSGISSENFYHGSFSVHGILMPCVFFYFSDINMGSLTYQKERSTEMFRFSLAKVTSLQTSTLH